VVREVEESLVALPAPRNAVRAVHQVRSTLLCAGIRALDERGLLSPYREALRSAVRSEIDSLVAGRWVPIELALAHYTACQQLPLDRGTIEDIGNSVGRKIQQSVISVLVRLSREAGATPWQVFPHVPRLNDLTWRGGAFEIVKVGPKDVRMDWVGQPLAAIEYYRRSFCGFTRGLLELFCRRCYVRVLRERCSPTVISLRIAWV
jgi:hypothetical protein